MRRILRHAKSCLMDHGFFSFFGRGKRVGGWLELVSNCLGIFSVSIQEVSLILSHIQTGNVWRTNVRDETLFIDQMMVQ